MQSSPTQDVRTASKLLEEIEAVLAALAATEGRETRKKKAPAKKKRGTGDKEVQDNARELLMRQLFALAKEEGASRIDADATLRLDGVVVEFELKSTTKGSVSTGRDVGQQHFNKWKTRHWLFGFFDKQQRPLYYLYAPPAKMREWIEEKEEYVLPDLLIANMVDAILKQHLTVAHLKEIAGEADAYLLGDAQRIGKDQYLIEEYRALMNCESGYCPARMLQFLRRRCSYLLSRGVTLNNPPSRRVTSKSTSP